MTTFAQVFGLLDRAASILEEANQMLEELPAEPRFASSVKALALQARSVAEET